MRNITIITLIHLFFVVISFGQNENGRVSYDVFVSSDDPQVQAYISNMEGSMLELYFHDGKVKSEFFMGEFMTRTTIDHKGNDTTLMLIDGMMGRIATKITDDDLSDEQKLAKAKIDVELVEGSKDVMGYACKKAIITGEDDNETIVWYTTDIVPAFRKGQYLHEDIPGVPLELNSAWGKMDLKFVAFEYKKKLKKPEEVFSTEIPSGYVLKTAAEMEEMRKRGGQR
jgi:GLPGLI family protein